jgi:hypothetical protein
MFSSIHSFAWDVHQDMIFYLQQKSREAKPMLHSYNLNTDKIKELYSIQAQHLTDAGRQLTVSQDGRSAFYPRIRKDQTDIVIIDAM